MTAYALWPIDKVEVVAGQDTLGTWSKSGGTIRRACTVCGSLVLAELPGRDLVDVFPIRLEGRTFRPAAHVHYAERIIDMADGLPKFADLPARSGGSGTMVED